MPATAQQTNQFRLWQNALSAIPQKGEQLVEDPPLADEMTLEIPTFHNLPTPLLVEPSISQITEITTNHKGQTPFLNDHQTMVHNIVMHHLHQHLSGENPPQRLMVVHGPGRTGKSTVLNVISDTFDNMRASSLLAKMAMSGVAASMIGGQTLHTWGTLPIRVPQSDNWITHPTKAVDEKRKKNMGNILWLTIDKKSMLTTPLLVHLSQATGIVWTSLHSIDASIPFGGLNIMLLGDFHQFPPVAASKKELYNSSPLNNHCQIGRNLFEQFDIVIKLDKQMRIHDPLWENILQRSCTGDCSKDDIIEIKKLVLGQPECTIPDFSRPPWNEAILITPHNSVRTSWNDAMLTSYCQKTGRI